MKNKEIMNNINSAKKILKTKVTGIEIIKYFISLSLFKDVIITRK